MIFFSPKIDSLVGLLACLAAPTSSSCSPIDVHPRGRWALKNQHRNQRNGTNANATRCDCFKKQGFFLQPRCQKKVWKKKSISWPSKKAVFHYVCKNKKSYDKNWVKVRSTKLSKLITWKKTPGTSKIKRYPRGRDSEGMHFTDFAAGEGSSNSSLKTHRRIIQSLPIFLQPSICWFTAMPGTHGCGAYVGSELFDDPSRGLGWRKW